MTVSSKAGRYELQQELGRGSMGVVYRALDPVIGRTVAVKTVQLTAEVAGLSHDELLARFQTEARAAGLLAHPNIVVVYDAGEEGGVFYITMELVEGRSLQEQLNLGRPLPLPRVLRWMQQACSALEFAHQHSVVHRDIKPANLMLTQDDILKVTDFGTAKILQLNTAQTVNTLGTPSHMSPEQIKGKPVDGRTDIFSLGVVFYELLTGSKPFPGETVTSVIYKVVNEDPVAPREIDPKIHPGLSAIVMRALAKSPWARFQTCQDFADALEHYKDFEEPRGAVNAAHTSLAAPVVKSYIPEVAFTEPPPERQTGSAIVALVLVAVIGAASYRVWPAVHEIWQRSHSADRTELVPVAATLPEKGTAATSGDTPQSLPALADGTNVTSGATTTAGAATTPSATTTPASAAATTNGSAAPTNAQPEQLQATAKPLAIRKASTPGISQDAAEWKDLIEAKLSDSNIGDDVRVRAAGNSVTLTGKLDASAHSKLLGQLQFVPAGLHIVDDIEYSDASSQQSPQNDSPQNKAPSDK